jgi:phosphoglycolate phosphatase-like HAD superfamily hydrolase
MATVFMDFDGTLNEMPTLWLQYTREVGALLARQFGGEEDAWAKAAADAFVILQGEYVARFENNPLNSYHEWLLASRLKTVEMIFATMNVPLPDNPMQFAMDTQYTALTACNAAFDGAFDCLQTLTHHGITIHLASANDSAFLQAALSGIGIEGFISQRFGPDLIDCAKEGIEFYERIFAQVGVAPSETLIVDDHPDALRWAMELGAGAVQVRLSREIHYPDVPGVLALVTNLRDLPHWVMRSLGR